MFCTPTQGVQFAQGIACMYIQEAINELVKEKTLIVIIHKLSSIKHADHIIVVDDEIAEQGNHETLIELDCIYKGLCDKRAHASSWNMSR